MPSPEPPASVSTDPLGARLIWGLFGAVIGAVFSCFVLGSFLLIGKGLSMWVTTGLLFPVAFLVAVFVGLFTALLHPGSRLPEYSQLLDSKQRRWRTALSGLGIVIVWILVGNLAVRLLAAFPERPAAGGVLTAASALGVLTGGAFTVDFSALFLSKRVRAPSARLAIGLALLVPGIGVPLLVALGTTSGVGGATSLFGTFRRPELDLSPVFHLAFVLGLTYLGARLARRTRSGVLSLGLVLSLLVGAISLHRASSASLKAIVPIERAKGLPGISLAVLRSLGDRDGDGYAANFGGGDCNDSRSDVHPSALDIPENGVDEDCRGGDKKKPSKKESPEEARPTSKEVPKDANVLLLTVDTLRWDLGFSGAKARKSLSPRLDALAERSTVFERAYSLASYTSKSLGPMLIGKYPSETKRTFEHFDRFAKDELFVQERLRKAGIRTHAVQGYWYFFFKGYGFERGWDELDTSAAPKAVAIEGDRTSNGDKLAEQTIRQLTELSKAKEPFFVWTHWVDPHAEYVPHEEFDFGPESRERYDGEVAFVDHQIGKILDALARLSLDQNTVIIVTSDHGEAFGEHGMIRHGFEVWEELVRVPLVVHVPGGEPKRVAQRRSLIDIAPTIFDAFRLDGPKSQEDQFRGRSLLTDVLSSEEVKATDRPVLVDMPEGPHNRERRAYYDGDHKLITSAGRVVGLFDLSVDPEERKDLSADDALVGKIRAQMDAFLDGLSPQNPTR